MSSPYDTYTSPLAQRNASAEMLRLWSPRHKFNTWRRIWLAVAEAQHELTRDTPTPLVTAAQVAELRAVVNRPGGITDDEIRAAEKYERELRHDVMAHVHALGDSCPKAKGIIHLGMTSQDVVCNADLEILNQAIEVMSTKIARVVIDLGKQARTRSQPTLAFTHYQPAQPVTVGRRFIMWCDDLVFAWEAGLGRQFRFKYKRRGLRGATGTQASYLSLLGDARDVDRLECAFLYRFAALGTDPFESLENVEESRQNRIKYAEANAKVELFRAELEENPEFADHYKKDAAGKLAEARRLASMSASQLRDRDLDSRFFVFEGAGQTYPRVVDAILLADLASTASVLHKIATDIRLLCNRKEIDEPFEDKQIGSSAMPYKRNPMRCERICGLTRFVMNLVGNAYDTAATQWLERTLDDSSNRRLSLPEAFLALDGALDLMHNVASGLIVHDAMVRKNLMAELPFMATENILMACVKLGGDRQHYHELIRVHAQAAGLRVKQEGLDNDLLDRLKNDRAFWSAARGGPLSAELDWDGVMDPMKYIGRSVEQTERFIKEVVEPLREQYGDAIAKLGDSSPRV